MLSCTARLFGEGGAGARDTSFGTNGVAVVEFDQPAYAKSAAIQADGKIVLAGYTTYGRVSTDFAVARVDGNGHLDPTFGTLGKTAVSLGSTEDYAERVLIQPDGKILLLGETVQTVTTTHFDYGAARLNTDGSLDTTFGAAGLVTTVVSTSSDIIFTGALRPDGRIVSAGYSFNLGTGGHDFSMVGYLADGTLDTSFGSGGKVVRAIGTTADARSIALQADGKIVLAGESRSGSVSTFALARFEADGTLDGSFGTGGITTHAVGAGASGILGIALQSDGKIIAFGYLKNADGTTYDLLFARYGTDGSVDTTFGENGIRTLGVTSRRAELREHRPLIQADGKILAVADVFNGVDDDFLIARVTETGALDATFGNGGITTFDSGVRDVATAILAQSDGRLVVTGYSFATDQGRFTLLRIFP